MTWSETKKPIITDKGIERKAPRHREAALRSPLKDALESSETSTQRAVIERIKVAYQHRYGLKNFKMESLAGGLISISGDGDFFLDHLHAIIGKRGSILYYRENNAEYKGKKADSRIDYILRDMALKGLYTFMEPKPRPNPTVFGIQFYSVDRPKGSGLYAIGINRNPATEKYFQWAFPDHTGVILDYAYMYNGGEGILILDTPEGKERISFTYEPSDILYVRRIDYEENLKSKLTNRQIIAKVFKAWLRHKNL